MEKIILSIISLVSFTLFGQEKIELPKNSPYSWKHELIPFDDGSYAVSANSWNKYITYMYSDKGELVSTNENNKDWRFSNSDGITSSIFINESLVDPATKKSYTLQVTFKKIMFHETNENFISESFIMPIKLEGFCSDCDRTSFIDANGKIVWAIWKEALKPGTQREVLIICFDPKTRKFDAKINLLEPTDAIFFDFLGFQDGKAAFGGMKQTGIIKEIALNIFTLDDLTLSKGKTMSLELEENIKPLYIAGIYYDSKVNNKLSFAIGVAKMDGPFNELSHGYKFIQMTVDENTRIISWWPEGLITKGKVPMVSVSENDSIEKILIKGNYDGILIDVNYSKETVSEPFSIKCGMDLKNEYFWRFFLSPEKYSKDAYIAFMKIVNPNNSETASFYECPNIHMNKNGHWVIVRCFGKEGRTLEITTGNNNL